jgi:uncharacterized membrane protein YfcA
MAGGRATGELRTILDLVVSVLDLLRILLGAVLVALGVWLFYRDCAARIRRNRETFPTMNPFVALKNTDVGFGFWVGLGAVLLGILLLPIR